MSVNIRPLHDRVIIERIEEKKTAAGIVIPDTAGEKPQRGRVVAVGTGKSFENGQVRPLAVKVGEEVIFGKYAGTEVRVSGKDYLVMKEEDIMGVVAG